MKELAKPTRPALWLAAAAVAAGWGAVYTVARWILFFVVLPVHDDVRIWYVVAEAGLRYGWSSIYDVAPLRSLSSTLHAGLQPFDSAVNYVNPPLLAWLFAPLTAFPEPVAYLIWTIVSLAALVWAWHIAAPFTRLAKATLLLVALAMWPVLVSFYFGQPTIVMLGLVAAAWWLCARDRPLAAGAALALATALKPHLVILLPLALLASARYRPVISWAVGCAVLGVASGAAIGPHGLTSWWLDLKSLVNDPSHTYYTLAYLFGLGPVTYLSWAIQGAATLAIARWRRSEVDIVFAAGVLGSVTVAIHLHQADYSMLLLAGWLVLRSPVHWWHRLWLLVGVVPMQVVTLGDPVPQLIWDAGWLGVLAISSYAGSALSAPATRRGAGSGARAGR